jgi:hypothetical protein
MILNVERAQNSGQLRKFLPKAWKTVPNLPSEVASPDVLRVTAERDSPVKTYRAAAIFVESSVTPAEGHRPPPLFQCTGNSGCAEADTICFRRVKDL